MSSRRSISNTFTVNTMDDPVGLIAQYCATATPTSSSQIHTSFQTEDLYMRTRTTEETFSGYVDPNHPWNKIVGESGGETAYSFNISKEKTSGGATTAPSNCFFTTWRDTPIAPTSAYPYLWMQIQKKDGEGNNVGEASYARVTGELGIDYEIRCAIDSIKIPKDATSTSVSTTFGFYYKEAGKSPIVYNAYYGIYYRIGTVYTLISSGSSSSASLSDYSVDNTKTAIAVFIFSASYSGNAPMSQSYLAKLELPIYEDGKDGLAPNPNILLRTVFDRGIDFVLESWNRSSDDYVIIDTATDTIVDGRKSVRLNAYSNQDSVSFRQSLIGKIKANTWYTLSFNAFLANRGGRLIFSLYNLIGGSRTNIFGNDLKVILDGVDYQVVNNGHNDVQIFGGWDGKRHTVTFLTNSNVSTETLYLQFYQAYGSGTGVHSISCICMPKLEEGKDATTYIANESDLIGADGESAIRVDISNQSDIIACDSAGNVRYERTITTQATLYIGSTPITTGVAANSVTIEGVTSSPENLLYSWTFPKGKKMSSAAYNATITLTYQGKSYSTTFKLTRTDAVAVYQVLPSAKAISFAYNNTQLKYVPDSIKVSCGYQKIDANGTTDHVGTSLANLCTSSFGGNAPYNMFYRYQKQDGTWTNWSWSKNLQPSDSYQITILNSTTYIAVEFAMSTSTSYDSVSSDNIIDRETIPIVKDGIKGEKGDKGDDGSRGKMGRNIYFAGKLSDVRGTTFNATDHEAPYVDVETGTGKAPNCYVYIGENGTNIPFPTTAAAYQSSSEWQLMYSDFKYLITDAMFAEFAKLGSGIFNKDWMFSQYGLSGKVIRNTSMTSVSNSSYTLLSNMTNATYKLRVEAGKEYEVAILCYSSSGSLFFKVFYNTNGDGATVNQIGNQNISTSSTSTVSLYFKFMAEFSGYAFIGCQGNGYVGRITSNTYDDYQNMSPSFVNNDEVKYISGHGAGANWEAVTGGDVFYVVAGMTYRLKASMTDTPSSDFVLSAYYADTDEQLGVANSSLTFNSDGSKYKEAGGDFVPSRSGYILFKGYSYGKRQWVEYVSIQPKNNFTPKVVIDWLSGYAHFGGDSTRFNPDGSGKLANGNIQWTKDGDTNIRGVLQANMMYSKTLNVQSVAGDYTYNINPSKYPSNIYKCEVGNGNLTIVLPNAGDYDSVEFRLLCLTSNVHSLYIKPQTGDSIYFVDDNGGFGWAYTQDEIVVRYDCMVVLQNVNGTWYVISGKVTHTT